LRIKSWLQAKDLFGLAISMIPAAESWDGSAMYTALLLEARGARDGGLMRYTRPGLMSILSDEPSEQLDRIKDLRSVAEILLV
jgi:hypothetical protein